MKRKGKLAIQTLLTRLGNNPKKYLRSLNTPLFRTSTVVYKTVEEFLKFNAPVHTDGTYGRTGTPTVHELQNALAKLDNADECIVVSSGMNAITLSLLTFLNSGDHLLISDAVYPCTKRFIEEEFRRFNIEYTFYSVDSNPSEIRKLVQHNTKVLFLESPASGTFEVQDIPSIVKVAKENRIVTIFDNSWATPIYFQPFDHGIDVTIQSLTKYISGHSDLILGAITFKKKHYKKLHRTFLNFGTIPSPEICSLILRSLKTLHVRVEQQNKNGLIVAKWLEKQVKVAKVLHPALTSFSSHKLWKRDFLGSTGTFAFVLHNCNKKDVYKFINKLKLFKIGLSWGGYESLIIPYNPDRISNNNSLLTEFHVRIHIGLESPNDLIDDLDKALKYL